MRCHIRHLRASFYIYSHNQQRITDIQLYFSINSNKYWVIWCHCRRVTNKICLYRGVKMEKKKLPVGIEIFNELIEKNYYYVDKTLLIKDIVNEGSKVTLFTRPRRFGKSLNISMLKNFFNIDGDKSIFEGLDISKDKEFCNKYMGKYPVISISLKGVNGRTFEEAVNRLRTIIGDETSRYKFLMNSSKLDEEDKNILGKLFAVDINGKTIYAMSNDEMISSLKTLTNLLFKHFGQRVILLIDEYDVPLDKAHVNGYYDDMVNLIRNMFENALKTNENLEFAVLTGCLRISKESIFTGLNNFKLNSITSNTFDEAFGFTENDIKTMLDYYELSDHADEIKEWYDGYKIGKSDIYCPWDVINYCSDLYTGNKIFPVDYWSNSSSNDIVREFVSIATGETISEIEKLVAGETIKKRVREDLTYRDIDDDIDNLWSVLFSTGYLTGTVEDDGRTYDLYIPNLEVHDLFVDQISRWFKNKVRMDTSSAEKFYHATLNGNCEVMEKVLCKILSKSISIRDTFVKKDIRENFYHGFMLGMLQPYPEIYSNREGGNGFSDILVVDDDADTAAILELKYSETDALDVMEKDCREALEQIEKMKYAENPRLRVIENIKKYGISFNKKIACVRMQ